MSTGGQIGETAPLSAGTVGTGVEAVAVVSAGLGPAPDGPAGAVGAHGASPRATRKTNGAGRRRSGMAKKGEGRGEGRRKGQKKRPPRSWGGRQRASRGVRYRTVVVQEPYPWLVETRWPGRHPRKM